jgi:hypothetical protein
MSKRMLILTVALCALAVPAAASADVFHSPSGNIHCLFHQTGVGAGCGTRHPT